MDGSALEALLDLHDGPAPRARLEGALLGPAREILGRPGKHLRARLVEIGWAVAEPAPAPAPAPAPEPEPEDEAEAKDEGEGEGVSAAREAPPVELGLVLEVLHAGSLVVDDVEDGSSWRRGAPALHRLVGIPLAVNTGSFLFIWPFALLRRLDLPPDRELDCTRRLADTLVRCHTGQALDLGVAVDSLAAPEVREIVATSTELKTGALVELALALPAAARGAVESARALARCGRDLGIGLQMLDDLGNLVGERTPEKFGEDLRHGRPTWPWAWLAEEAEHYEAFRPRAAAARRGRERLDKLAGDLLQAVGERGRAEASARMASALARLEEALGRSVPPLHDVVRSVEEAYV